MEPYQLTATQMLAKLKDRSLTVEEYARSLLSRIEQRDATVKAWAYLDPTYVIRQARELDQTPMDQRGPLHGIAVAVKDVIYTKDMPTQFNSSIYEGNAPKVDAASVAILRKAGVLFLGKTTTTEFAATTVGPKTSNPHDPTRTPGGSSSGSGAAVGDLQATLGLGTQTGGSTIRPGSFNGIYAFKPTWNAISREGQKVYALLFDTLGLYARSVDDLELLADVFALHDDALPEETPPFQVQGAKFAMLKTMVWPEVGAGTAAAMEKAADLLRAHGAEVEEIALPPEFDDMPHYHRVVLHAEGRVSFLPEHRTAADKLHGFLVGHVENEHKYTRAEQLRAWDSMAALRPKVDAISGRYAAIVTPSVPDEAPKGLESTGSANFCSIWTGLHTPTVNVPGFKGENGMPIGLTLVAPRYHDRHLLTVAKAVGRIFEAEGGWDRKSSLGV
ncbi:amidase signature enzyme [Apiospora arundinis]|uniref:Amidase signature enzyme n=1 Tax=Apiospora arundinis TaxID=335852 RepID=A0ABR2I0H3_9PEZI